LLVLGSRFVIANCTAIESIYGESNRGHGRRNVNRVEPQPRKSLEAEQNDSTQHAQEPGGNDDQEWHGGRSIVTHLDSEVALGRATISLQPSTLPSDQLV